jgi:hypothetical protein
MTLLREDGRTVRQFNSKTKAEAEADPYGMTRKEKQRKIAKSVSLVRA